MGAIPKKYSHINFTPPNSVSKQAELGLMLRKEFGRGGTMVGVSRARDLKNQRRISPSTIRRMASYFARHAVDKLATRFGDVMKPSAGYIAWLLWGGDVGQEWVSSVLSQMNTADRK